MNPGTQPGQAGVPELPTVETTIDGAHYEMAMLPGGRSWRLWLRIMKMLGPSAGKLVDGIIQGAKGAGAKGITGHMVMERLMSLDLTTSFVGDVVETLTERMTEDEMALILGELAAVTFANTQNLGAAGAFDRHFMGPPVAIMKWLAWALQAQWGNFRSASDNGSAPAEHSAGSSGAAVPVV